MDQCYTFLGKLARDWTPQ